MEHLSKLAKQLVNVFHQQKDTSMHSTNIHSLQEKRVPLHEAAHKSPLISKILIKHGANGNQLGKAGTLLHLTPHVEIAQLLIDAGANLEAKNYQGETPVMTQKKLGHHAIVSLLLSHGALDY